jgi:hypothetical protein
MTYFRSLTYEDIPVVIDLPLKDGDVAEIKAMTGQEPWEALVDFVRYGKQNWVIVHNDKIEGIFGIQEISPKVAIVGLLTTDKINEFKIWFIRKSKQVIEQFQSLYPFLFNYVDEGNALTIKWLQYNGFIKKEEPYYFNDPNVKFYLLYRLKEGK